MRLAVAAGCLNDINGLLRLDNIGYFRKPFGCGIGFFRSPPESLPLQHIREFFRPLPPPRSIGDYLPQ